MQKRLWLLAGLIPVTGVLASCATTTFDTSELEEKIAELEQEVEDLKEEAETFKKNQFIKVEETYEVNSTSSSYYYPEYITISYYSYNDDYIFYGDYNYGLLILQYSYPLASGKWYYGNTKSYDEDAYYIIAGRIYIKDNLFYVYISITSSGTSIVGNTTFLLADNKLVVQ